LRARRGALRLGALVATLLDAFMPGSAGAVARPDAMVVLGDASVIGRDRSGPRRFQLRFTRCAERVRSEWRASDGTLLAFDDVLLSVGGFTRYSLSRKNLGQSITVIRTGNALRFVGADGGTGRTVLADAGSPLLAGPMLVTYIAERLDALRAGRELRVGYVIADRGMVLRLRIAANGPGADGGLEVHADAASALLRPFVPTTSLSFDSAGTLVAMSGLILPQDGAAGSPIPIEARVVLRAPLQALQSGCHAEAIDS
jgi:hypothetical protein